MRIRPSRRAIKAAALIGVMSLSGFVSVHFGWMLLVLLVILGTFGWHDYRALPGLLEQLHVSRELPSVAARGRFFRVVWRLSSTSDTLLNGTIRDETPETASARLFQRDFHLTPQQREIEIEQSVCLRTRGNQSFGPLWIRLAGPFGILEGQRPVNSVEPVRVLPETFAAVEYFRKDAGSEIRMLDLSTRTRQQGEGTEFDSLHEFRDGDDPRRIDWRATARARTPIVAKFQVERHRDVMVLVDCGRLMGGTSSSQFGSPTKLDSAIDAALMLGRSAIDGGDRCGMGLFDHTVRSYLPPVSGRPALGALVNTVYSAPVQWTESDFGPMFSTLQSRQSKRSLIVVLSDVTDTATTDSFRSALAQLTKRHVVLFVAIRTPYLDEVVLNRVLTLSDASRQGTVFRLLHERELTLQSLRHTGVQILDVPPQAITVPLINQYLAIRRSNRL